LLLLAEGDRASKETEGSNPPEGLARGSKAIGLRGRPKGAWSGVRPSGRGRGDRRSEVRVRHGRPGRAPAGCGAAGVPWWRRRLAPWFFQAV